MFFAFTETTDQPQQFSHVDDGWVIVQVHNGVGVWLGKTRDALTTVFGDSSLDLRNGFLIQPSDGVVKLPWSGDIWLFATDRATNVYGVVELAGCQD